MSQPIILLDVDGVIADFRQLYVDCCNQANGTTFTRNDLGLVSSYDYKSALKLTDEQMRATWTLINEPGRAASMTPLPGAIEGVQKLLRGNEVHFITSSPYTSPTWDYDRREWLRELFGRDAASRVHFTADKHLVFGHVFVDDRFEPVARWKRHHTSLDCVALLWQDAPNLSNDELRAVTECTTNWVDVGIWAGTAMT
jgi:5'(3')-deoxyribonucleotidase